MEGYGTATLFKLYRLFQEKKSEENVTDKSGELATDNLQAELVVERRMVDIFSNYGHH